MRIIRSLALLAAISLPLAAQDTTWEKLGYRFGTEWMRDHINTAAKAAIKQDKIKVGSLTLTEAGDVAEYAVVAYSKADRTHELLARLATNSLWHLLSPVLKQVIHDKSSWDRTELIMRTVAKFVIRHVIDPYIPK